MTCMMTEAVMREKRVARATPATSQWKTKTNTALPTMLMRFMTMLMFMLILLLPRHRKMAAPAL